MEESPVGVQPLELVEIPVEFAGVNFWVVGAHGGAGTSSWARALGAGDAGLAWPQPRDPAERTGVWVCAREDARGLACARQAGLDWVDQKIGRVRILGLILTPIVAGKRAKGLEEEFAQVEGIYPHIVRVPFLKQALVETDPAVLLAGLREANEILQITDSYTKKEQLV